MSALHIATGAVGRYDQKVKKQNKSQHKTAHPREKRVRSDVSISKADVFFLVHYCIIFVLTEMLMRKEPILVATCVACCLVRIGGARWHVEVMLTSIRHKKMPKMPPHPLRLFTVLVAAFMGC